MKKRLGILVLALVAGIAAFWSMRSCKMAARNGVLLDSMSELAWVRSDLKLTDAQFAKVAELHAAYRPNCVEMCRRIAEVRGKVEELAKASRSVTPELEAALREHAETHAECQQAMLRHLYETAATLDPDQARTYLETMLPMAMDSTHGGSH
jgi:Spy/CpxP family protein refolding chaperone